MAKNQANKQPAQKQPSPKPQGKKGGTWFGLLLSITKWFFIIITLILFLAYCGVFTQLGCFRWMDSKENADGNLSFKGIAPWVHAGEEWAFHLNDLPDGSLKGRVVLVTGANAGLGFSSSVLLASKGADVVMACRSRAKCSKAVLDVKGRIRGVKGKGDVEEMILDLSSFESIRTFAENFEKKYGSLHSLMLNAGIMRTPYGLTADGIEQQIGVNHFGHFYLTKLLLPILRHTGTASLPATIVTVSSSAHFRTYSHGVSTNLKDLNNEKNYETGGAYGQSKLANVLFTQELAERESGSNVIVNAIHPGAVDTELARYMIDSAKENLGALSGLAEPFFKFVGRSLLWDSDTAALTQVFAAVSPKLLKEKVSGKYFHPIARPTAPHAKFAGNVKMQRGLWDLSEEVVATFEAKK